MGFAVFIWDHPFKTSANFHVGSFFTTIRQQIWPILDPSPPLEHADVLNGWSLTLHSKPKVVERLHGLALPNSELEIKLNLLTPKDHYMYI